MSARSRPAGFALQARAAIHLIATRVTLRRRLEASSLPALVSALARGGQRRFAGAPPEPAALARAVGLAEAVLTRSRAVPDTCLYRALGRFAVLARAGVPVRFVMGIRRDDDGTELTGHAWLEYRGTPLGETPDPRFVVTFAFPDPPPPAARTSPSLP